MLFFGALGSDESNVAILDLDQELLEALALSFEPASGEETGRLLLRSRYLGLDHDGLSVLLPLLKLSRQSLLRRNCGMQLLCRDGDAQWLILFIFGVYH